MLHAAIFQGLVGEIMEVFMDDFSVFGNSFDICLHNLENVLQRYEDTHLALNWEKCHFIVQESIVLGHKISKEGIEVDRTKVETIERLRPPSSVKALRSFLHKLTNSPILVAPDWSLPFELMCDVNDYAIGVILGQRKSKHFQPIYYA
ncbi:hypothetical protein M9H77_35807 [Catharanthus roseus]|uniref:Uncharacterized protein n=1 Tax=Catharanthus roseus TaxID=4058 RepID=A0ACB9ZU99_CATRO|nr:hypothetical protein M9H77_35807 [Catharanthus roseus]